MIAANGPSPASCRLTSIATEPDDDRLRQASALFYDAFGRKIPWPVLPKDPQAAIELLASTLRPSEVYVVHAENGSVVATGIVTGRGPVLRADREVLTAAWGRWGGLWRFALVRALRLEGARRDTVSIEGLVVREECRGSGLGSALLERIIADAAEEGFSAVTLDVGDDNPRARRLYERHGFIVERKLWVPPVLRGEARFRHLIFMRLELTAGARTNAG